VEIRLPTESNDLLPLVQVRFNEFKGPFLSCQFGYFWFINAAADVEAELHFKACSDSTVEVIIS